MSQRELECRERCGRTKLLAAYVLSWVCEACATKYTPREALERGADPGGLSQPPPTPGRQEVTSLVISALEKRLEYGRKKYGTALMTWNGRDPLADAMEEELDRLQYLAQARLERADLLERVAALKAFARDLILFTGDLVDPTKTRGMHEWEKLKARYREEVERS